MKNQPQHPILKRSVLALAMSLCLYASPMLTMAAPENSNTVATSQSSSAQEENPLSNLDWHIGPQKENVVDIASLQTLKGEGFLDKANSDIFLKETGNLPSGSTNILVAEDDSWWATFDFDPIGYVKDDEKIDADALLKELKSYDEPANQQREQSGLKKLYTVGWAVAPHYDPETKQLEWALKLRAEDNHETINYTIRILGRTGVMSATLISDEENLTQNISAFKTSLKGFQFNNGEQYSQFRSGDKVAEYGLAALIAGGAAVVATKKGFWAAIAAFFAAAWKFIAMGVVAAGAWLTSLFKKKK